MKKFITVLVSDKKEAFSISGNVHGLGNGFEIEVADDRNEKDLARITEYCSWWLQSHIRYWP